MRVILIDANIIECSTLLFDMLNILWRSTAPWQFGLAKGWRIPITPPKQHTQDTLNTLEVKQKRVPFYKHSNTGTA